MLKPPHSQQCKALLHTSNTCNFRLYPRVIWQQKKINLRSHFYHRPLFLKKDSSYVLWVGLHRRLMSGPALKLIVRPNNNKKEIFLSPENGHPTHKLDHWKG